MGKKVFAMLAAVFVAVTFMPAMASADLKISNSGWLGTVEGFEGIVPGSTNTSALYNGSWFDINITPPYNFGNGANLLAPPAPPYTVDNAGPYIRNFTYGAGMTDQLGSNGAIGVAPFGNAYLGIWRDGSNSFSLTFKFDMDVYRAGAYFTGWPETESGTYYLKALDAAGIVLESYTISTVNVSNWANNFVGIERADGFRQLQFDNPKYGQTVLDNVQFQPVPIPATLWLLGAGLVGLVGVRRKFSS